MTSKLHFACAALVGLLSISNSVRANSPGDCFPDENPNLQCGYRAAFEDLPNPHGPGDPQPESPWTDVLQTKIDIEVAPAAHTIVGTVTITAKSSEEDGLLE